ncbi:FecR family protein [Pseudomonas taetrolens]|uniref:FecR family protein n=1 Tax=Pseudomonas taetrolens TaxID=47884 RepID=UPI0037C60492
METRDCTGDSASVRDAAASWFARQQAQTLSAAEQAELAAWRLQHATHEAEYQWLVNLWSATDLLPKARLQALCESPAVPAKRRSLLRYAVAASVLAVAAGAGLWLQVPSSAGYRGEFSTVLGERREITLPDGSSIELNGRSRVRVHFEYQQRKVDLEQGEAMFSVAVDRDRPFVVLAGAGQVTVTGTRFDVRRDGDEAQVAVESGHVRVQGASAPEAVNLTAGLGTLVDARGRVAAARPVDTQALTAWRKGQLVFNDATLGEVAAEVSRYREQPLHVSSPALARLRVSSVFKTDDTDALLKALPRILPVAIQTRADGSQEVIARK